MRSTIRTLMVAVALACPAAASAQACPNGQHYLDWLSHGGCDVGGVRLTLNSIIDANAQVITPYTIMAIPGDGFIDIRLGGELFTNRSRETIHQFFFGISAPGGIASFQARGGDVDVWAAHNPNGTGTLWAYYGSIGGSSWIAPRTPTFGGQSPQGPLPAPFVPADPLVNAFMIQSYIATDIVNYFPGYVDFQYADFRVSFVDPNIVSAAVIPEPSTYALMAAGLAALGLVSRHRKRRR